MKHTGLSNLIALVGTAGMFANTLHSSDLPSQSSYDIHASLKLYNSNANETRRVFSGINLTNVFPLEVWVENVRFNEKPVIGIDCEVQLPIYLQFVSAENLSSDAQHYTTNGKTNDYFAGFTMSKRNNEVVVGGDIARSTFLPDKFGERQGPQEVRAGLLARFNIRLRPFLGEVTNVVYTTIGFINFNAYDEFNKKSVKRRSLPIAIMPVDYAGVMLKADINDGEVPANDVEKDGRGRAIINGRTIGYEPFYAVGAKASGNFVLQRSTNDASGPYTTVQTISPGTVGSFNDREAFTNNWKTVFYRLVPENGIQPASSPSSLENKAWQ